MTWVSMPIETDAGRLSRPQRTVLKLSDGDTCRVRTRSGEDTEATVDTSRGGCVFRDDDGEALDVVAVWADQKGGASGKGGETDLVEARVYLSAEERAKQKAIAKAAGLSWSAWARRKLAT